MAYVNSVRKAMVKNVIGRELGAPDISLNLGNCRFGIPIFGTNRKSAFFLTSWTKWGNYCHYRLGLGPQTPTITIQLARRTGMSEKILQINYRFNVAVDDYVNAVAPMAGDFAAIKGLCWKVWLLNEERKEAGGIMLFEDQESLDAFLNGPLAAKVTGNPALSDFSVRQFGVMKKETGITRGPLEVSAKA